MKKNMGSSDQIIRIGLAIIIVAYYFNNVITGMLGLILMIFMGVLITTCLIRFCPFYFPFGINSKDKLDDAADYLSN